MSKLNFQTKEFSGVFYPRTTLTGDHCSRGKRIYEYRVTVQTKPASVLLRSIPFLGGILVIRTVHYEYGFGSIKTIGLTPAGPVFRLPGYEVAMLCIACLLALIFESATNPFVESDDDYTP